MLVLLLAVASAAAVNGQRPWPTCHYHGGECAAAEPYQRDGRDVREYVVGGRRLSVSFYNGTLQWKCAPGFHDYDYGKVTFPEVVTVQALELHCPLPSAPILQLLSINSSIPKLFIKLNEKQSIQTNCLSQLSDTEITIHSEQLANLEGTSNLNWPKRLMLHRISINHEQLEQLIEIEELTLSETGLDEIPNLKTLGKLQKLVIREPLLTNAIQLNSAPALVDLTLEAPDAALDILPQLKKATFINIYIMGRIFGNCSELEELSLLRGWLDSLREGWLDGCVRLRRLQLSWLPKLRALPNNLLTDAVNLTELNLSHNTLSALPEDLLTNNLELSRLDLSHNQLKALPQSLLANKQKLVYLDISYNALSTLPDTLVNYLKVPVKSCDMSNNNFSAEYLAYLIGELSATACIGNQIDFSGDFRDN